MGLGTSTLAGASGRRRHGSGTGTTARRRRLLISFLLRLQEGFGDSADAEELLVAQILNELEASCGDSSNSAAARGAAAAAGAALAAASESLIAAAGPLRALFPAARAISVSLPAAVGSSRIKLCLRSGGDDGAPAGSPFSCAAAVSLEPHSRSGCCTVDLEKPSAADARRLRQFSGELGRRLSQASKQEHEVRAPLLALLSLPRHWRSRCELPSAPPPLLGSSAAWGVGGCGLSAAASLPQAPRPPTPPSAPKSCPSLCSLCSTPAAGDVRSHCRLPPAPQQRPGLSAQHASQGPTPSA